MKISRFITLATICIGLLVSTVSIAQDAPIEPNHTVIMASEVEWTHLNPKRGDLAPKAGTLWGDRNGTSATGFLLKPADGFQSPPHIHNVSYRGIVISGLIHNDDPNAAEMWLPAGSFWTQPKGEVHITAAKGTNTLAYIEIEEGPYLVLPTEQAFDSGERPVNLDQSNVVWLDASNSTWITEPEMPNGPKIAFLWGHPRDGQLNGSLVKLPAGFTGEIHSHGSTFRAVVIQGQPEYIVTDETEVKILDPGSYFSSQGEFVHQVASPEEESIFYIRTKGTFDIIPAQPAK